MRPTASAALVALAFSVAMGCGLSGEGPASGGDGGVAPPVDGNPPAGDGSGARREGSSESGSPDGGDAGAADGAGAADAPADAPALAGWSYVRQVRIDNTGLGALTNLPILLALTASNFTFANAKNMGDDIRVTDASGTQLDYEIEKWEAARAWLWVRVPAVAAGGVTILWLYYGNPMAMKGESARGVWDSSFLGVWHLVDGHDSTMQHASMNHGAMPAASPVGPAMIFNGSNQYVDTGATEQLGSWTLEVWLYGTVTPSQSGFFGPLMRDANYDVTWDCNPAFFPAFEQASGGSFAGNWLAVSFRPIANSTWYSVASTYDGATLLGYKGGVLVDTKSVNQAPDTDMMSAKIGANEATTKLFTGSIDEVRISTVPRSADWLAAEYRTMSGQSVTIGPEVP